MFRTLLIANRGEVAARVVRTAKRMGIRTVLPVSAADQDQQWLHEVDEVVPIGPAPAARSYLDQDALLEVARHTGATAVHPGWGFLAENAVFAARCEAVGLTFVGPSAKHMLEMGDKSLARATMRGLGLDPIPGSRAPVSTLAEAHDVAASIGYPVLLKAVAGGGGRGMRGVETPEHLEAAYTQAAAEAVASFGDGRLYLERRILRGRHVEVQILADHFGTCLALGERECSMQRRHQKVVEEGPSPGLSHEERQRILPLVADVVRRTGYVGAGTVEMLLDQQGTAWFMEMNTRLQVEHAVTEALTGLDLVELQLRIAARQRLTLTQADIKVSGHAMEWRINAEDPDADFRPSPGLVRELSFPSGDGIRVDTHLTAGDRVPPNYDAMIAKLIIHGNDRADALRRSAAALQSTVVEGVKTNVSLHHRIVSWPPFGAGDYDTTSLEHDLMGA
ncbi:MAG: acetyl-CoA carboxylase biotin carboxylase subunit [Myxococcota bacterium]